MPEEAGRPTGLLESLKSIVRTLLSLARTRLEILGNEIEEQRALLVREALLGLAALFFAGLGIIFTALSLLILFWDSRLWVAALLAALFFAAALAVVAVLRAARAERPRAFAATIAELDKDSRSLG